MSPLLSSKSLDKLRAALKGMQHDVCPNVVAKLLRKLGYSLQNHRKTREGSKHPDRDAQFQYLDARVKEYMLEQSPVISVDTKKKGLVGDFKNAGQELRPKASPEEVRVHDFIDRDLWRAVPYGIYDIADNKGWVSVGVDHDTAAFAVNTIRRWWRTIEHRLFAFITKNLRNKPRVSHRTIVQLIGAATTGKSLAVRAELDTDTYPVGIKVSDAEMATVAIQRHAFHGEWNYTLRPRPS